MEAQTNMDLPRSIRFAQRINRVLSWGMQPQQRQTFLVETLTDWEEMHRDRGSQGVTVRALRGIPAAVWARFDEDNITALPASLAIALVGLAALGAGLLDSIYPVAVRRFIILAALGTFILGAILMSNPRRIVIRRYRLPTFMLAAGFLGMATHMPEHTEWQYDSPFVDTVIADVFMLVGFTVVGIGFSMIFAASFLTKPRVLAMVAGILIMMGTASFAGGQIAWGIAAVATDPAITATSIGVGLASLSFLHVLPRLRHLELT